MGLGILGLLVLLCIGFTQTLFLPFSLLSWVHLPNGLWFSNLQNWLGLTTVLCLTAWLIDD